MDFQILKRVITAEQRALGLGSACWLCQNHTHLLEKQNSFVNLFIPFLTQISGKNNYKYSFVETKGQQPVASKPLKSCMWLGSHGLGLGLTVSQLHICICIYSASTSYSRHKMILKPVVVRI